MIFPKVWPRVGAAALAMVTWTGAAAAHPHAFISVQVTAVFEGGKLKGVRQNWLFDDLYSQQALEGLKPGPNGEFGATELAELTKANMDGLKEFKYFTEIAGADGKALALGEPTDDSMVLIDSKDPPGPDQVMGDPSASAGAVEPVKVLSLSFFLPLATPTAVDAKGVDVAITDPEIYIWFSLVRDTPVRVEGATQCQASLPKAGRLGDAIGPAGVTDGFKQSSFRLTCAP
jgi:ABC-type uncharacterized transport system substrate-binding protein